MPVDVRSSPDRSCVGDAARTDPVTKIQEDRVRVQMRIQDPGQLGEQSADRRAGDTHGGKAALGELLLKRQQDGCPLDRRRIGFSRAAAGTTGRANQRCNGVQSLDNGLPSSRPDLAELAAECRPIPCRIDRTIEVDCRRQCAWLERVDQDPGFRVRSRQTRPAKAAWPRMVRDVVTPEPGGHVISGAPDLATIRVPELERFHQWSPPRFAKPRPEWVADCFIQVSCFCRATGGDAVTLPETDAMASALGTAWVPVD
ncbi:MAG: hypothetical protein KDH17_05485 [Rhodocyclaceae bacterium]|nr:hypothetical protein [Rhodocyclaceae bacterium]